MSFKEQLIHLRNTNGLSQEDLAEKLNVTRQSVSKWEVGETMPDTDKLIKISEIFNVSTDYLLKDIDNVSNSKSKISVALSKEVNETIENINKMSRSKRYIIGLIFIGIIFIIIIFLINIVK
ncbi:helix-turn-helix transcriptional regulator [uncultured Anaerofustis sp.]|uniref:helix-turn-helix domain-containing protein n=1 Tax=uncultured Anaerofustis sp. TaxID=904996 RepID=UPI0025D23C0A|nr:helix-turn-helix transcriptional regulator [uncultured Anaerofustis sp.]